jgi:hypothetical protein
MKNSNQCGFGRDKYTMAESRETHTYIADPTGKGEWMTEKIYRTVNYQVRTINL